MGRTRTFDREEALEKALRAFWQEGYERTSLEDLLKAMGIKNSSFYQAFGSKENLFIEALAYYRKNLGFRRLDILRTSDPDTTKSLQAYFYQLIYRGSRQGYPIGCFITQTMASQTDHGSAIGQAVQESIRNLENAFADRLTRGQKEGDISKKINPRKVAHACVSFAYGLTVLGRAQKTKKELYETALAFIELVTAKS